MYSSEAYSETDLDETVTRRITEFGDDYSYFFPSLPPFPCPVSASGLGESRRSSFSSVNSRWSVSPRESILPVLGTEGQSENPAKGAAAVRRLHPDGSWRVHINFDSLNRVSL